MDPENNFFCSSKNNRISCRNIRTEKIFKNFNVFIIDVNKIKADLELLEKIEDFDTIGNFQEVIEKNNYNFEELINTIKSFFFYNVPKV